MLFRSELEVHVPADPEQDGVGHVDLEFTVERDGSVTGLKLVKSIGNAALDKASANAILAGRFLPLPSDFAPPRVTMQVSFYYGEGPQG